MAQFNEADHPRDNEGKFTYKNGGGSSSNTGIIDGKVEKTDSPDDRDNNDESEGGGIGEILSSILNPQTISTILNILATKYSISEMKKIKDALYEYMERNSNSENENGEKAQCENIQNENAEQRE